MFNLLPDALKQKIKSEYTLRWFSVLLTSILFIQLVFLCFLFPSWLVSLYKEREVVVRINTVDKTSKTLDTEQITTLIASINTKLEVINSKLQYPRVLPIVNSILSKKTNNIYVNGIIFTSDSDKTGSVTIRGVSYDRDSLVSFVKKLQGGGLFKNVDLPISNFARDKNIDFSINAIIEL